MKILLDTRAFLWALTDDPRLRPEQRQAFCDAGSELYLSAASLWEILIKTGLGRLRLPSPTTEYLAKQMDRNRIVFLPVRVPHLQALESLPPLHRDPFDRMLVAQAQAEGLTLMSCDEALRAYRVDVI